MTSEQWARVKEAFENTRALSPQLRSVALAEIGDEEVRREVDDLLKTLDSSPEFLEQPAVLNGQFGTAPGSHCGQRLGKYLLVRQVGEGGMGVVYEAQRADGEFEQRVAVKIVRRWLTSNLEIERFRNERQILARLDHPNIARLSDGGTTDDGLPFLVMDFVAGVPIDKYCEQHSVDVPARVQLFRQACEAVEYAHDQGIVHRDLKPANILVTAAGKPKLLDFGIAKISDSSDAGAATATQFRVATPGYASPEQLRGEPTTPASDIYSLGVLLYELITGKSPCRDKGSLAQSISGTPDREPPPPSQLTGNPSWRQTLDRIVERAMQKHPAARYANVRDLIADIDLYLNGATVQPAAPRAPNRSLHRFMAIAAVCVTALLLLAGAYLLHLRTARQLGKPKSLAVLPFRHLTAPTDSEYLGVGLADALITRMSNISQLAVRPTSSILKYANANSDARSAARDLGVDAILEGNIQESGDRLRITVQLIRASDGVPLWADSINENSAGLFAVEDSVSRQVAQKLALQLAVGERQELARHYTENAAAYRDYLQGRYAGFRFTRQGLDQAIEYFNRAIARDPNYALAYAGLADGYTTASDWVLPPKQALPKAEAAARKALSLDDNLPEGHASLAHALMHEWKLTAAGAEFQRALALNPNNTSIWFAYAEYLSALGRQDDAIAALTKALGIDPQSVEIMAFLGWPLYLKQDYGAGLAAEDKALQADPNFWMAHMQRAYLLLGSHSPREAATQFLRAIALNPDSTITLSGLGAAYADAGDREKAVRVLAQLRAMAQRQYVSPMDTGFLEAALGDRDRAMDDFTKGYEEGSEMLLFPQVYARYYGIGNDPRFQRLVHRLSTDAAPLHPG